MPSLKRSRTPPLTLASEKNHTSRQVRFLILSDTHSAELPDKIPPCDVVLHCGDLTEDGTPESISKAITSMGSIEAELKLVIAGNHEISLDNEYFVSEGGSAEDLQKAHSIVSANPTSVATKNGVTFLEEGTYTFTLKSGASFTLYASPYTPVFGSSAFQYPSCEDRYSSASTTPSWAKNTGTERSRIPDNIDIVMTHGPAQYILDSTGDGRSAGCEHLRRAIARVQPKLFCFGHVHTGYGAQRLEFDENEEDPIIPLAKEWVGKNQAKRKGHASLPPGSLEAYRKGKQTLAVNAAMEGEEGILENVPWLVELELESSFKSP